MLSDCTVVIAAAGIGSRLGMNMPKALVEIQGKTVLERLLTTCLADMPDVRLVVGFREDEVTAHALSIRKDLIIVRNPNFRETSVRHSFWLAARHVRRDLIIVDGDMLIDPGSFRAFRARATEPDAHALIGVSPAASEDAVYAQLDPRGQLQAFSRQTHCPHEWCGVAKLPARVFDSSHGYVFEAIEPILPAPAFVLRAAEIDTRRDLDAAKAFAKELDLHARQYRSPVTRKSAIAGAVGMPANRRIPVST